MNKICTSIEQSEKLIELGIDVNTADMYYGNGNKDKLIIGEWKEEEHDWDDIPAWSLTALLAQMPGVELVSSNDGHYRAFWHEMYSNWYNPVDACVELILRERKENG